MQIRIATFLWIIFILNVSSCGERKRAGLWPNDYRLFEDTPAWDLAEAAEKQRVDEIARIAKIPGIDINFQEPTFGNTVLILTVLNNHVALSKALLEAGADLGIQNRVNGSTALIEAAEAVDDEGVLVRLLLENGADPNQEQTGPRVPGNTIRLSPLLAACRDIYEWGSPIKKVTALVEAGADVNYEDEFGNFALTPAVVNKHYDVVLYLLEKGADYRKVLIDRGKFQVGGKKVYIADLLREGMFPLGSKEHAMKMEVVAFLKTKSIDYHQTPIPDFVVAKAKEEYGEDWQTYLNDY